jgi:ubiquinol-cytochrome c reductase cytochrome b/c1 subunit
MVTGIVLAMHYVPNIDLAFTSLEHLMRDVPEGWMLRGIHANGASFFFLVIYAHICRGLVYGSYMYPRAALWYSGVIIFIVMIITAFLGYILPWGQMSFWGATVITNLASTVPWWGDELVRWLWGGFSVANATLNKFYSLHFVLPFVLLSLVGIHLYLLHKEGSSNPLGVDNTTDKIFFTPYYALKDYLSVLLLLVCFTIMLSFAPDYLGHSDNYLPANSDVTPEHIVPEWYFLPFYAVLRAIPNKTAGVLALFCSLYFFFSLPSIHKSQIRNWLLKRKAQWAIILFMVNWVLLGYLGMKPIEEPYLALSKLSTIIYFSFFLVLWLGKTVKARWIVYEVDEGKPGEDPTVTEVTLWYHIWDHRWVYFVIFMVYLFGLYLLPAFVQWRYGDDVLIDAVPRHK